ncbi:MAG: neutral/alkaline non-lysosomal ceramidase N-terminal domain-containing protein [Bryobacterales bacterium]|nr:neutral/alkaline non-lysosomal ceramidase N-terminal domain-containing protein [Bryobacterales bacterium]
MKLATFALLLACLPAHARLRAGAAAADITPQEWPVRLIGNFGLTLARSAHDPLHARAIVVEDGGVRIAIALIDSCYVKREEMDRAKELASKRTGIPAGRILISATHTHSAPPSRAQANNELEIRYVNRLVEQTADAIARANQSLRDARMGWAILPVPEELHNRRWFMKEGSIEPNPYGERTDRVKMNPRGGAPELLHPSGTTDPQFFVVSIQTASGKPLAMLANYSLHYVGGIPGNQVSADYFGEFSKQVAEKLAPSDPAFVAMLTNGTSGDVNNIDFIHPRPRAEPFERIRAVAGKLATHAARMSGEIQYQENLPVRMSEQVLKLRFRKPTAEQLKFARAALAEPDESKLPLRAKPYAERAIALQEGPEFADLKLQALRIGPLGITAIPCEVFTEIGLTIKELSPLRPTFTIELANGHYGYLPTPRHYALGGYETWLGTNNLEPEASVKITRTILSLLEEIAGSRAERGTGAAR